MTYRRKDTQYASSGQSGNPGNRGNWTAGKYRVGGRRSSYPRGTALRTTTIQLSGRHYNVAAMLAAEDGWDSIVEGIRCALEVYALQFEGEGRDLSKFPEAEFASRRRHYVSSSTAQSMVPVTDLPDTPADVAAAAEDAAANIEPLDAEPETETDVMTRGAPPPALADVFSDESIPVPPIHNLPEP